MTAAHKYMYTQTPRHPLLEEFSVIDDGGHDRYDAYVSWSHDQVRSDPRKALVYLLASAYPEVAVYPHSGSTEAQVEYNVLQMPRGEYLRVACAWLQLQQPEAVRLFQCLREKATLCQALDLPAPLSVCLLSSTHIPGALTETYTPYQHVAGLFREVLDEVAPAAVNTELPQELC